MNEFTKGPWNVPHDDSPYWAQARTGEAHLPVSSEEGIIAHVKWQRRGHEGNARLIAAAGTAATKCAEMGFDGVKAVEALPELLGALQMILDETNAGLWDHCLPVRKGYDALAKARGEA